MTRDEIRTEIRNEILENLTLNVYIEEESPADFGETSDYLKVHVTLKYNGEPISTSYDTIG